MSKKYLIDESELGEYYIEANEYKNRKRRKRKRENDF